MWPLKTGGLWVLDHWVRGSLRAGWLPAILVSSLTRGDLAYLALPGLEGQRSAPSLHGPQEVFCLLIMFLETLPDFLEYIVPALHLHQQVREEHGELLSELIQDTPKFSSG